MEIFASIFLIGVACLMLELIQTRMLSFFLGSISNFLAIPIALFGLALGSLYCHFFHRGDRDKLIRIVSVLVYPVLLITFISFFFVADTFFSAIHVGLSKPSQDVGRTIVYSLYFLPAYMLFGILLSSYFSVASHMIGRLYFYDLVGAGMGCLITSLLFTYSDLPPVITTLLLITMMLIFVIQIQYKAIIMSVALVSFIILQAFTYTGVVFKEHPDSDIIAATLFGRSRRTGVTEVTAKWNHLTRVGLYRNHANDLKTDKADFVIVQDDGMSNVGLIKYDPDMGPDYVKEHRIHHALPHLLGKNPKSILVMFAGSGKDMIFLDAISQGDAVITGVELNDAVREMALHPAAFSMNIRHFFKKPNINYVIREGRDFLNNTQEKYDLILVATNGAVHASRIGHTRKYLDTYEAVESYLDHMHKDSMIIFVNQPIERKMEAFRQLFEERGLPEFNKCVYAFGSRGSVTLQSAVIQLKPFTERETEIIHDQRRKIIKKWETVYNPVTGKGSDRFKDFINVPPEQRGSMMVVDNQPFIHQVHLDEFSLFPEDRDILNLEYASNWIKIFTCLMFVIVSLVVILVIRFAGAKEKRLPMWWLAYFFVSGISYMGVEIGLMGKTELFVGNPLYAIAIILAFFLTANGLGAWLQDKYQVMRGIKTLIFTTALTIIWAVICVEIFNNYLLSVPMIVKVLLVAVAVLPSGTALGMYYPFGVATLAKNGKEDCVAVTYGAATLSSVLGSALAMTLLPNFGFNTIIIAGAIGYISVAFVYLAARKFAL
ncbi:MAG: hypothetical protein JXX14_07750 [Deltaproteobacteria bacterium]|nr:hypothetical protein [Deltaproteobacteria bacterium]